jgi:hypothetical protein
MEIVFFYSNVSTRYGISEVLKYSGDEVMQLTDCNINSILLVAADVDTSPVSNSKRSDGRVILKYRNSPS